MRFKFVFSAEWPSLPQCLALCLNIIIHSFEILPLQTSEDPRHVSKRESDPVSFFGGVKGMLLHVMPLPIC